MPLEHHFFIIEVDFSMLSLLFVNQKYIQKPAEGDESIFKKVVFWDHTRRASYSCGMNMYSFTKSTTKLISKSRST